MYKSQNKNSVWSWEQWASDPAHFNIHPLRTTAQNWWNRSWNWSLALTYVWNNEKHVQNTTVNTLTPERKPDTTPPLIVASSSFRKRCRVQRTKISKEEFQSDWGRTRRGVSSSWFHTCVRSDLVWSCEQTCWVIANWHPPRHRRHYIHGEESKRHQTPQNMDV